MLITQEVLNKLVCDANFKYNEIEGLLSNAASNGDVVRFNNIWLNKEYEAIYNPLRSKTDDEVLGYFTPEDNWNEYSKEDRLERINKNKESLSFPNGWVDWNTYSLEQLVDYLKHKYRFVSTGEAHAIYSLIDFYEQKKDA